MNRIKLIFFSLQANYYSITRNDIAERYRNQTVKFGRYVGGLQPTCLVSKLGLSSLTRPAFLSLHQLPAFLPPTPKNCME